MSQRFPHAARLIAVIVLAAGVRGGITGSAQTATGVDREYLLQSTMLGYRGMGGEIDGIRNPTLWARTGETVRITIVNGELMVHDIALERQGVKSGQILDRGATTSITFKADKSDVYYCTVPGHRLAGMEGRLEVSEAPPAEPAGIAPTPAPGPAPRTLTAPVG